MIHTSHKCTTFTYINRHENHCSRGVYAVIKGLQKYFLEITHNLCLLHNVLFF